MWSFLDVLISPSTNQNRPKHLYRQPLLPKLVHWEDLNQEWMYVGACEEGILLTQFMSSQNNCILSDQGLGLRPYFPLSAQGRPRWYSGMWSL